MRLLDLFCGAGGAAEGYHRAGFDEIVGVDMAPQPRYPFRFVQADAMTYPLDGYDAIHASPPCQAYTPLRSVTRKQYPDLLDSTRQRLIGAGVPWVIENVPGAPIGYGVMLCGTMFNLRVYRHRWFETSHLLFQPAHPRHTVKAGGHKSQRQRKAAYLAGGFATVTGNVGSYAGPAMGITWMTGEQLSQAIPPPYTEWIGCQMLAVMASGAA